MKTIESIEKAVSGVDPKGYWLYVSEVLALYDLIQQDTCRGIRTIFYMVF